MSARAKQAMQVDAELYRRKDWRLPVLLHDVPLHDVWRFRLRGGGPGRTMQDFRALWQLGKSLHLPLLVRGLFGLRMALGRLFGWDRKPGAGVAGSYVERLPAADRERSVLTPGTTTIGPFRAIYADEREILEETINKTVHAFSHQALEPVDGGYVVYWAIFVKNASRLTPLYMRGIDPFRRRFVYPALIRQIERAWEQRYRHAG